MVTAVTSGPFMGQVFLSAKVVRNNKISAESVLSATGFNQLHCLANRRSISMIEIETLRRGVGGVFSCDDQECTVLTSAPRSLDVTTGPHQRPARGCQREE